MPDHTNHTIDYLEFGSTDLPRTKAFYGRAFGWTFTDWGDAYAAFEDGALSGGFERVSEVRPGGPLVILYADDLEASLRAVRDAGATIVRDVFAFPGGRRFHFADPSGNELAVWGE